MVKANDMRRPSPPHLASSQLSKSETSNYDLESGALDSSFDEGRKIASKFITIGNGDAEFLRRQSQMGRLSRRKSELSPTNLRTQSSNSSTDCEVDFMERLATINSTENLLEEGLPMTRSESPTTSTTSNKDRFVHYLKSSASIHRGSVRVSPPSQKSHLRNSFTMATDTMSNTILFNPLAQSKTSHTSTKQLLIISSILLVFGFVIIQNNKISSLQTELKLSHSSRDTIQKNYLDLREELNNSRFQNEKIIQDYNDLTEKLRDDHDRLHKTEMSKTWSGVRYNELKDRIQDWSRNRVIEKFGNGPYRVELQIILPTSEIPQFVKLELAPLNLMPHAVSIFLEQIEQKSWDGQVFDVHSGHVLFAHHRNLNSENAAKKDISTIMFPEYNEDYPHEKYTIGFPMSNDAGQKFYINLQDNVDRHSPRFERDAATGEDRFIEGEPCFGKISDQHSRMVVDEMNKLRFGGGGTLMDKVEIVSARLIGRKN